MKVILLKDVPRVGKKYEVKEIADGHAFNYLIPRRLAEPATPEKIKRYEAQRAAGAERQAAAQGELLGKLTAAQETGVTITAPANEQGHLFKAVHAKDIVAELSAAGVSVAVEQIMLELPIKQVGTHRVPVQVGEEQREIPVHIVAA